MTAQAHDPFEQLPDPACILDAAGELLRANTAFAQAFRQAVSPRRPPWGRVRPPAFEGDVRRFDAPAPDGRLLEWIERRLPDGHRLAIARDVSQRANAAEAAARAKTLVFAMLTHELRTPLNGILGMAGLLGQEPISPAQRAYALAIAQSGERLLELISDALDYSRLEAGRSTAEIAPFRPVETAQSVLELLAPRARAKGLELVLEAGEDSGLSVLSDEGRVRQILFNLVGNALKFTETGGVCVRLSTVARGEEAQVNFSVRDTGPGVAPDKRAMIFEAFEQADASHARAFGGAGLGLAIVKRLADLLGAKVAVSGALAGPGAVFTCEARWPLAPEQGAAPVGLHGANVRIQVASPLLRDALGAAIRAHGGQIVLRQGVLLFEPDDGPLPEGPAIAVLWPDQRERIPVLQSVGIGYVIKPVRSHSLALQVLAATGGPAAAPETAQLPEDKPQALAGLRVLLAEDNPLNALIARTILTRAGALVDTVSDGEQAIAAAKRGGYEIYVLDLRMPVIDGLTAGRRIRALHPEVPIIALTADAGQPEREAALASGMDAFMTKPIDAQRLAAQLQRFTLTSTGKKGPAA